MGRRKVVDLEKWGESLPPVLAMLARQGALTAEDCYETCRMARSGKRIDGKDMPLPVEQWQSLYQDENRLMRAVGFHVFGDDEAAAGLAAMAGAEGDLRQWTQKGEAERVSDVGEVLKALGINDLQSLREFGKDFNAGMQEMSVQFLRESVAPKQTLPEDIQERLGSSEVLFFFRVWFPCWLEYGIKLPVLVERAKGGDLHALRDLLRLDKTALEIPEVRRHYLSYSDRKGVFRTLNHALGGQPLRKLTRRKVKVALAAFLYKTFQAWDAKTELLNRQCAERGWRIVHPKCNVTAPMIQDLFDAAARYQGKGLRDPDLPRTPHSFYIALTREMAFWPDIA